MLPKFFRSQSCRALKAHPLSGFVEPTIRETYAPRCFADARAGESDDLVAEADYRVGEPRPVSNRARAGRRNSALSPPAGSRQTEKPQRC
jgi:hypothetical protein